MKTCKTCGGEIPKNRAWTTKYCSSKCYPRKSSVENKHNVSPHGTATATTGTISEYIVAIDLLRRGFEVFRAVSSSCSCDLVVNKNNRLYRIEVKTGYYNNGQPTIGNIDKYLNPPLRFDVLAIVTDLQKIKYISNTKRLKLEG